jgi:transcriptional regulator GlxA family with amidase domain
LLALRRLSLVSGHARRGGRLLELTDDRIEVVARRSGYAAAVTMRAQFGSRLRT